MIAIPEQNGVSVILCCHNSSGRIKQTLIALAKQEFFIHLPWEIILVDNASDDNTASLSREVWQNLKTEIPLQIVYEPAPGLGNARKRGISESSYSIVLFCDDDNWFAPTYIQIAYDILSNNPKIAACGGIGIPFFETKEPEWFKEYQECFAIGSQEITSENGRILNLYGAGLAIQKKVLSQLFDSGFVPLLVGRTGKKLSSSEDLELTYSFVLMGYELYYTSDLRFSHYLPKERLSFDYLKKLFIAFGTDGPIRNLYYAHLTNRSLHKRLTNWYFHFGFAVFRLFKYYLIPPKNYGRSLYFNWSLAYLKELLSLKDKFPTIKRNINRIRLNTTNTQSEPALSLKTQTVPVP